jgi:hypothetical protein
LADLDGRREQVDGQTVLVVDEAGMLGSRKPACLLDHAQQAQGKVVLVGMTGSFRRSTPVVASAPCGCGWAPRS